MDVYPKFIIENNIENGNCLIIGKCTFHKQLAFDIKKVKGGGWWYFDDNKESIILHGSSHDFGAANIDDIINSIKNEKVFTSKGLSNNITNMHKFKYKNIYGEIIDIS